MNQLTTILISAVVGTLTSIIVMLVSNVLAQRNSRFAIRRNLIGVMRELAVWTESCRNELEKRQEFGIFADAYRDNIKVFLDRIRTSEVAQAVTDDEYQACYSAASTGMINSFADTKHWKFEDRTPLMQKSQARLEAAQTELGDRSGYTYSPWLNN